MGWEEKLERARRLHRPSLKNWQCDDMYHKFPRYQEQLEASRHADVVCCLGGGGATATATNTTTTQQMQQMQTNLTQNLPIRVDASTLQNKTPSAELYFEREFQRTCTPTVIQNVPTVEGWLAVQRWTLQALENDEELGSRLFKCGEDDDGRSIKVKLRHFMSYLHANRDDSPLYIFDTAFDEDKTAKRILKDYKVPVYFRNDLFRYVSESRRPPYRWFLVGPERSGTTVHTDPLGTSAWNTLLVGKKRWVLFPPHVPKSIVKGRGLIGPKEDDEAIHYFTIILPRILHRAKRLAPLGDPAYENFQCYEFTQHAGETVYVPTGWWHAVLNLEHTVGCTQNFCSPANFDDVWCQTRKGRKKMAWKWLQQLKQYEPDLYQRAMELNERDEFVMKYDPAVRELQQQQRDSKHKRKSDV